MYQSHFAGSNLGASERVRATHPGQQKYEALPFYRYLRTGVSPEGRALDLEGKSGSMGRGLILHGQLPRKTVSPRDTWHRVPMTGSKCDDHLEKHFWAYDLMDHLLYAQEWNKDKPKHLLQFDDQWAKTANTNRKPNTTGSSRVCVPLLSVFRYTVAQVDPATGRHVDIMDNIMTGDKMEDAPHVKAQWNLRELRNVMSAM